MTLPPAEPCVGTARCEACGYEHAEARFDGEEIHVTCDVCGFEMWGRATETTSDPPSASACSRSRTPGCLVKEGRWLASTV
jgi:hypothetical protein